MFSTNAQERNAWRSSHSRLRSSWYGCPQPQGELCFFHHDGKTDNPTNYVSSPAPSFLQSLRLHVLGLGNLSFSLARMAAAAAAAADVEELHEWHVEKAGAHPCFAPVPREEAVRGGHLRARAASCRQPFVETRLVALSCPSPTVYRNPIRNPLWP